MERFREALVKALDLKTGEERDFEIDTVEGELLAVLPFRSWPNSSSSMSLGLSSIMVEVFGTMVLARKVFATRELERGEIRCGCVNCCFGVGSSSSSSSEPSSTIMDLFGMILVGKPVFANVSPADSPGSSGIVVIFPVVLFEGNRSREADGGKFEPLLRKIGLSLLLCEL